MIELNDTLSNIANVVATVGNASAGTGGPGSGNAWRDDAGTSGPASPESVIVTGVWSSESIVSAAFISSAFL